MQQPVAGGPRLSVVVPCYNEAEGIGEPHRRVTAVCRDVVAAFSRLGSSPLDSTKLRAK